MSDQEFPSPEKPTVPGGADDHNRDHPPGRLGEPDGADTDDVDPDDSSAAEVEADRNPPISDPGGDSDPFPERDL